MAEGSFFFILITKYGIVYSTLINLCKVGGQNWYWLECDKFVLGVWVAQLVKRPTLDFGSGYNLTVCELEPRIGLCADSTEPAWNSLSPSFSAPSLCACMCTLSLSLSHK